MTEEEKKEQLLKEKEAAEAESSSKQTENTVPQARLNEVVGERNILRDELATAKTKLEENATAQKLAEDKKLETQGEFEKLADSRKTENELITKELESLRSEQKARWELIKKEIPKDKLSVFAEGESNEVITANLMDYQKYVALGLFEATTIPSIDIRGNPSNTTTDKAKIYFNDKSYNSEKEFMAASPNDYGKWVEGLDNLDNAPIGVFKKDGKEYLI